MKSKIIFLMIAIAFFSSLTFANPTVIPKELAVQAVSDDSNESEIAVKELRKLGPLGLQTLFETYAAEIENYRKTGEVTQKWQKIAKALDKVAMQKDVYASQLFWNTDLEKAKAESKKSNKPILSLRLLGNLNDELSCANSRFFRSILYPNAGISNYLRQNYILHWQSERPAPKITIDFGDGRKIERTITGNSIHYILDQDGKVVDALSGLNSPSVFLEFINTGNALYQADRVKPNSEAKTLSLSSLTNFRGNKYRTLMAQLDRIGKQLNMKFDTTRQPVRKFEEMPPGSTLNFSQN